MKKCLSIIAAFFLLSGIFLSCSDGSSTNTEAQEKTDETGKDTETKTDGETKTDTETKSPVIVKSSKVTFDFSNAQAIAQLESSSSSSSRAATNADELGDFVKILADGSMKNAITVEGDSSLASIVAVYKSPLATSSDVFVVFSSDSYLGEDVSYDEETGSSTYTYHRLGQLLCVHEDGSVADILNIGTDDSYGRIDSKYISIETDSVQFDVNGNLYFISKSYGYTLSGEQTNGQIIYQFNPATNEVTEMVAAVQNTTYQKLQIDGTGQWIFASGSRSNAYFLRAIPVSNPNAPVNVFYSTSNSISSENWVYDDNSGTLYFIVTDGNNSGLFTATKSGGFRNKTFQRRYVGEGIESDLLEYFRAYSDDEYSWGLEASYQADGSFDALGTLNYLVDKAFWVYDYANSTNGMIDAELKTLSLDMVDIRFDAYANGSGAFRALALLTAGKKNEDAFNALNSPVGKAALDYILHSSGRFSSKTTNGTSYYEHSFLADILYVKDSDTLLVESEDELFSYTDSDGEQQSVTGVSLINYDSNGYLRKNSYGYIERFWYLDDLIKHNNNVTWVSTEYAFAFIPKFYTDNQLNSAKLLEYLFSFCNVDGSKEFKLTAFKDDEIYGDLYSTLTDEAALTWLASDIERMNLLGTMFISNETIVQIYNNGWQNIGSPQYGSLMRFLAKTCFINGTDTKAVTWNDETLSLLSYSDQQLNVSYGGYLSGENEISIYSNSITELSVNENGVFGICTNLYNWNSTTSPYFYTVQIADSEGNFVEMQNKLPLPNGKVIQSQNSSDHLLLQYALTDDNGAEFGYHHIYAADLASGTVTNCFDNVPNRNGLEVVSFSAAGDMLYYSAVRGTAVENGIVNISTNEYNPLSVTRKMVAVYTFK